jgi:hypothetical protein
MFQMDITRVFEDDMLWPDTGINRSQIHAGIDQLDHCQSGGFE